MDLDREKVGLKEITGFFSNIWVVNDTLYKYENTYAEIILFKNKEIVTEKRIEVGCIPADGVKHLSKPPRLGGLMNLNLKEKGKSRYVGKIEYSA